MRKNGEPKGTSSDPIPDWLGEDVAANSGDSAERVRQPRRKPTAPASSRRRTSSSRRPTNSGKRTNSSSKNGSNRPNWQPPGLGFADSQATQPILQGPVVSRRSLWTIRIARVLGALVCLVLVGVTSHYALQTRTGQYYDLVAMAALMQWKTVVPWELDMVVLGVVSAKSIAAITAIVVLIALFRRRWLLALRAAIMIAVANGGTQLLKHQLFERAELEVGYQLANSLPSGHTTAAGAAAIGAIMVIPRRYRSFIAVLGALWTAFMGVSTLLNGWHRPADVVAAVLWVAACGVIAAPAEAVTGKRPGMILRRSLLGAGLVLTILGGILGWQGCSRLPVPAGDAAAMTNIEQLVAGSSLPGWTLGLGSALGVFGMCFLVMVTIDALASTRTEN